MKGGWIVGASYELCKISRGENHTWTRSEVLREKSRALTLLPIRNVYYGLEPHQNQWKLCFTSENLKKIEFNLCEFFAICLKIQITFSNQLSIEIFLNTGAPTDHRIHFRSIGPLYNYPGPFQFHRIWGKSLNFPVSISRIKRTLSQIGMYYMYILWKQSEKPC